jgi:hypothetical protein
MSIVYPHRIGPNISYLAVPYHQKWTKGKSKWTISVLKQRICLQRAYHSGWLLPEKGWGLHYNSRNMLDYLGVAQDHKTEIFIAKFEENQGNWHGYPADHERNNQDIPDKSIRQKWQKDGVLPPAKIRKIGKGQPCSLPN